MSEPREGVSTFTITGVAFAAVLVPLNSTMIAVALPRLAKEFHIEKGHAGLLVTVYLAAMLVGQPLSGRLGDAIGARRLGTIAVIGFGVFSTASMLSTTFVMLVVCRAVQAVFASAITPSVQATLRMITTPEERGRAFGLQNSVIGVGAGLGPVIGGLLIATLGWRAIFGINIPLVLAILYVLRRTVPISPARSATAKVSPDDDRPRLVNPVFASALGTQSLAVLAQYSLLLVTPLLLDARGWGSGSIGLALSLLTLGQIVMSPVGGRWGDLHGRRSPVVAGLAVAAVAVAATAVFGDDPASTLLLVVLLLFGLGLGLAIPGITTAGLESAPVARIGLASGVLSAARYVGSIAASLVLALVVDDDAHGVGTMFVMCVVALTVALATASRFPHRPTVYVGAAVSVDSAPPRSRG